MNKRNYGLFTAIAMITGVVIGSGIFFKTDDVLAYTNGNVLLGVFVFFVAATAIVYGCLAISQLATRTDKPGGLIAYAEEFVSMGTACAFGWFQTLLYLPTLCAVVSWVIGIYFSQLLGIPTTLEQEVLIGIFCMTILFVFNTLSAKLGGYIQNSAMIIKLIPLFLIAIMGIFAGNSLELVFDNMGSIKDAAVDGRWITAFAPIAFSFDGWIVSTSICHEIKNSKKNLPIALTVSPFVILIIYIMYYLGMNFLVGTETILQEGDASVFLASYQLFGELGAKLILIFVIISILGTVNGIVLGLIRMPYSLALRNMIPGSKILAKEEKRLNQMPLNSAIFVYLLSLGWMLIHYITQKFGMPGDVSEIAIGISYMNYIVLYFAVMRLAKKGVITSKYKGYVIPVLATLGSFIIISGSISHPLFVYYILVCLLILFSGWFYYKRHKKHIL